MARWIGVDVGGPRKGFDAAVVDDCRVLALRNRLTCQQVADLVMTYHPAVVAIDSPRSCAPEGRTARECELQLARQVCGIRWTPDIEHVRASPYYAWILEGLALFGALDGCGAEVIEVFPTASWTRWHGRRGPRTRTAWSRQALTALDLDGVPARTNQDQRDAIAAALTARQHTQRKTETIGGIIVPLAAAGRAAWLRAGVLHKDPSKGARVDRLSLGVMARSLKENERRLAIHPLHVERIAADLRERIYLEHGYGERFGVPDEHLAACVAGLRTRAELVAECDVILLPKPQPPDLGGMREGQVLWGWPHCVQDKEITQLSVDRRLTLIAFEAMNYWSADGSFRLHVFHKNNEMAGYCSVLHALELTGMTGEYGRRLRAAVIGFGATGRGAVTALNAHGVNDVDILTHRDINAVASPIHSARMVHFEQDAGRNPGRCHALPESGSVPMAAFLAGHDIVVNCVLQDTEAPLIFVTSADLDAFAPGSLIVDVSCDRGMGFSWARPTSFAQPMLTVGNNVRYYGVDHSPSYLWDSATWEISEALLPYLRPVLAGPAGWDANQTVRRAVEIRDGVIQNQRILSFQHRSPDYPHLPQP